VPPEKTLLGVPAKQYNIRSAKAGDQLLPSVATQKVSHFGVGGAKWNHLKRYTYDTQDLRTKRGQDGGGKTLKKS